jgi:hypothetical protein
MESLPRTIKVNEMPADLNASSVVYAQSGLASMNSWTIPVVIFIAIPLVLFFLSKNFRAFIYGAIVCGLLGANYAFSRYVGNSAQEGNYSPLKYVIGGIVFIVISIGIGYLMRKTKVIKKLEKEIGGIK